jgi:Cu(I)/Ag(I) efflux system membrane fusion protein
MALEQLPAVDPGAGPLALPASAVLDSGTRKLVYVGKGDGLFQPREVTLGPRAGDHFPVLAGIAEGERVVVRGGFLLDSQFQVTGHPSLFYPGGLHAPAAHAHGAAPRDGPPAGDQEPTARPVDPHGGHKR